MVVTEQETAMVVGISTTEQETFQAMSAALPSRADINIMHAWGIKIRAWRALTEAQRIYYRTNVATVITSTPCNA
jgi:hypothetical protein